MVCAVSKRIMVLLYGVCSRSGPLHSALYVQMLHEIVALLCERTCCNSSCCVLRTLGRELKVYSGGRCGLGIVVEC